MSRKDSFVSMFSNDLNGSRSPATRFVGIADRSFSRVRRRSSRARARGEAGGDQDGAQAGTRSTRRYAPGSTRTRLSAPSVPMPRARTDPSRASVSGVGRPSTLGTHEITCRTLARVGSRSRGAGRHRRRRWAPLPAEPQAARALATTIPRSPRRKACPSFSQAPNPATLVAVDRAIAISSWRPYLYAWKWRRVRSQRPGTPVTLASPQAGRPGRHAPSEPVQAATVRVFRFVHDRLTMSGVGAR
jgi:hypothetical protein